MWPLLIHTDTWALPTYIVVNSLAFSLAVLWIYLRAPKAHMDQNKVLDVTLAVMIACFVGARLFHIVLEEPRFYWEHPSFIFKFWYGGFVYYGGALGGFLAASIMTRRLGLSFFAVGDLFAPVMAGGYALGRLGCLAAGCCFGAPTTMPWGIHFPPGVEAPTGIALHPTQIYSSLWSALLAVLLLVLEKRPRQGHSPFGAQGQIFGVWMALHGLGRLIIEQFRDDFRGPTLFNLSVSTWISGFFIIGGVYIVGTFRNPERIEKKQNASAAV